MYYRQHISNLPIYTLSNDRSFGAPQYNKTMESNLIHLCIYSGDHQYLVATYRMFKISNKCGKLQEVTYKGDIPDHEDRLLFDHNTTFEVRSYVNSPGKDQRILLFVYCIFYLYILS